MQPDDFVFTPLLLVPGELAQSSPEQYYPRDCAPGDWGPHLWGRHPLAKTRALTALKAYAAWAGLKPERLTPQVLRYTGARRILDEGASLDELAAFLQLKNGPRLRQLEKRLRASIPTQAPGPGVGPVASPPPPPGPLQRRRPGPQPGNRNRLKHGLKSRRFSLRRVGIHHKNYNQVPVHRIPAVLQELDHMMCELDELPEETQDIALKKLDKLSRLLDVYASLKIRYWMRLRKKQSL
jgi:hypothetical protein